MALLLDNDVVHKLAQLDMLDEAIEILNVDYGEIYILDTMKYKFCHPSNSTRRSKQETRYGLDIVNRIDAFIAQVKTISEEVTDPELINAMNSGNDLDIGEMQLLSALLQSESGDLLFTGDKRFLKALAQHPLLADKLSSMEHCFISFEQIMMLLINGSDFDKVKSCVSIAHEKYRFDKTIRCCFEGLPDVEINQVQTNIRREIIGLTGQTGNLLCSEAQLYSLFPSESNSDTDNDNFVPDFLSILQN